jgi:hypothetical protein
MANDDRVFDGIVSFVIRRFLLFRWRLQPAFSVDTAVLRGKF